MPETFSSNIYCNTTTICFNHIPQPSASTISVISKPLLQTTQYHNHPLQTSIAIPTTSIRFNHIPQPSASTISVLSKPLLQRTQYTRNILVKHLLQFHNHMLQPYPKTTQSHKHPLQTSTAIPKHQLKYLYNI
jgi:hypothetical protein